MNISDAKNKGSVLLMVLGILALLSLLGAALVFITRHEKALSTSYVDKARAQLAAESGVETAIAKLGNLNIPLHEWPNKIAFGPEPAWTKLENITLPSFAVDINGDGMPDSSSGVVSETYSQYGDQFKLRVESAQSKLNINDTNSPMNIDTDPFEDQLTPERDYAAIPEHMQHPSGKDPDWAYRPDWYGTINPDVNGDGNVDQADVQYETSVFLNEIVLDDITPYDMTGDGKIDYDDVMRLTDIAQSYDGFDASRSVDCYKPHPKAFGRLDTIMEELLYILFGDEGQELAWSGNKVWARNTARSLFKARRMLTGDRFDSVSQVREVLRQPGRMTTTQIDKILPLITLESWQDTDVLRPTFRWSLSLPPENRRDDPGDYNFPYRNVIGDGIFGGWNEETGSWARYALDKPLPRPTLDDPATSRRIYFYSDMQTKYFEREARAPVNINQVNLNLLQALIRPIQGWFLKEEPASPEEELSTPLAEDWSQGIYHYDSTHVMDIALACTTPFTGSWFNHACIQETPSAVFESWKGYWYNPLPYKSQFYYYDSRLHHWKRSIETVDSAHLAHDGFVYNENMNRYGELQQTRLVNNSELAIADELAYKLYARIHEWDSTGDGQTDFKPFSTWEEFEDFVHDLSEDDSLTTGEADDNFIPGFTLQMADAVIANFNPNSRINDYNPNKTLNLQVDKSQLIVNTAEFCFHPMGYFNIESLGMVLGTDGKLLSTANSKCHTKLFELFRVSSQGKFMRGYVPDPYPRSGSFTGPAVRSFFSESTGVIRTASAVDIGNDDYYGHSIQSYPEPENPVYERWSGTGSSMSQLENLIAQSLFDGYLMLSVFKPGREDLFPYITSERPKWIRANGNFDGSLNLVRLENSSKSSNWDYTLANKACQINDTAARWVLDPEATFSRDPQSIPSWKPEPQFYIPTNQPGPRVLMKTTSEATVLDPDSKEVLPGNLYPDGAYSDAGRGLMYDAMAFTSSNTYNNIPEIPLSGKKGQELTLQFWIKPNWSPAHSNRIRNLACAGKMGLYYLSRGGPRVPRPLSLSASHALKFEEQWLPTRSLFWHVTPSNSPVAPYSSFIASSSYGLSSSTVNYDFNETTQDAEPLAKHHFGGHQWNHLSMSWNWRGVDNPDYNPDAVYPYNRYYPRLVNPERTFRLSINGTSVDEDRETQIPDCRNDPEYGTANFTNNAVGRGYVGTPSYPMQGGISNSHPLVSPQMYVRFGESSTDLSRNYSSDSTYDNIQSMIKQQDQEQNQWEYGYGRYYNENDAVYTSPEFNVFAEMQSQANLLTLQSISWTGYWPLPANENVKANHPRFNDNRLNNNSDYYENVLGVVPSNFNYNPNNQPDPMAWKWGGNYAPFSVDVFDPATNNWLYESISIPKEDMPNYAGGSIDPDWQANPLRWEKARGDKLRFRVHFNIAEGQTLFTSPIFDDITFIFKMDKAQILYWEQD